VKDCEDIEIITPPAALNKAALAQQIDGLDPKGMTPITGAIRKAFEAAPAGPGATTIVLFSDGLETCGGDPCRIVSQANFFPKKPFVPASFAGRSDLLASKRLLRLRP